MAPLGWLTLLLATAGATAPPTRPYVVVDTGQVDCFDASQRIDPPAPGEPFWGQDAQFHGPPPTYRDLGDGTVLDEITGLMWVQACGEKMDWETAKAGAATCRVAGHDDWRLPTIKELYSLILFTGLDPSGPQMTRAVPFLDHATFEFRYGDEGPNPGRVIDSQYWSSTAYVGEGRMAQVFGVNFADGRIKGYPRAMPGGRVMLQYARYVRGNEQYGVNDFQVHDNGTIEDRATGLTWSRADSGEPMDWPTALAWAAAKAAEGWLGAGDWRLPNAKELQSLVDYTRSPLTTDSPAIAAIFESTPITDEAGRPDWGSYWTSTTHANAFGGQAAAYVAFGSALGWMQMPPGSGQMWLVDVHGAGAQRSDPKVGDARQFPWGRGPQGDVIRIRNLVRLVRGGLSGP